jgi:hypothetical protein
MLLCSGYTEDRHRKYPIRSLRQTRTDQRFQWEVLLNPVLDSE